MKFISQAAAVLILLVSIEHAVVAQEQKIVFCAESIRYGGQFGSAETCSSDCRSYTTDACLLQEHMSKGWQVVATTPKELPVENSQYSNCSCIGTQYVLKKSGDSLMAKGDETRLLTKEVELLRKENEMLKNELEKMKKTLKK